MYYNARYYDSEIGQFISPDSIVTDPTNVFAYNRYMYVLGNPLKFSDPSGHIAVCFQGGHSNTEIEAPIAGSGFLSMCQDSLSSAGYDEEKHGQILYLTNGVPAIEYAYEQIIEAKSLNSNEPVIIAGYSWGGSAALDLADMLGHKKGPFGLDFDSRDAVSVDLLYLIDPENDFRGLISRTIGYLLGKGTDANSRRPPLSVDRHVKTAISLFAEQANTQTIQELGGIPASE